MSLIIEILSDIKVFFYIFRILQQCGAEQDKEIKFDLRLCFDVLFDLFQFGDRRRLTKLERVGRRFHHLVEKCFRDVPFLRLDIQLAPLWLPIFFRIN